ncbi:MAG: PAS domain-containing protein [Catalinimonas sp.]
MTEPPKPIKQPLSEADRLRLILESTTEGWWEWDVRKNQTYHSPQWYRMLGYTPDEFASSVDNWIDIIPPDDRVGTFQRQSAFMERDDPWELCFRMRCRKGDYRWVLSRGRVTERDDDGGARCAVGTHQDVTGYHEIEQRLRQVDISEKLLHGLVQVSPASFDVYDFIDKCIVYSSGLSSQLLGYTQQEYEALARQFVENLVHPDDRERLREHVEALSLTRDHEVLNFTFRMCHQTGEYRWITLHDTVFRRDKAGRPTQFIGAALDVTRYCQMEAQLKEKLANLDQLSQHNAHEVRGPVATILGLVNLMKQEARGHVQTDELIGYLETTVSHLDGIIRDYADNLSQRRKP